MFLLPQWWLHSWYPMSISDWGNSAIKLRKTLHLRNVSNGAVLPIWHGDPEELWRQTKMVMKSASWINKGEELTLLRESWLDNSSRSAQIGPITVEIWGDKQHKLLKIVACRQNISQIRKWWIAIGRGVSVVPIDRPIGLEEHWEPDGLRSVWWWKFETQRSTSNIQWCLGGWDLMIGTDLFPFIFSLGFRCSLMFACHWA
jgi:hypothetical protein